MTMNEFQPHDPEAVHPTDEVLLATPAIPKLPQEPPAERIIRVENVSIGFNSHPVLQRLSFQVAPHETVALIGESGCGKSVTLKLLVGLLKPNTGSIFVEGLNVHTLSDNELTLLRMRVGFLFQGAALFDSLSVFENVAFGLRSKGGLSDSEIADAVRDRLQEVGLPSGVETKMPAELSGGMKKRVGLARALALNPDVMLYDEPTTGLDPIMTDLINELILQTRRRRPVTSIVVTHEMRTVRKVADRVIMLYPQGQLGADDPQVIFDGTVEELMATADPRVRQFVEGDASQRMAAISQ